MSLSLPGYGLLSYNSYVFVPPYSVKSSVKPEYGEDGCTHMYDAVTLEVTSIHVLANRQFTDPLEVASVDYELSGLRTLLMQPRKQLICSYQGAPINAQIESSVIRYIGVPTDPSDDTIAAIQGDVLHGPTPLSCEFEKIAQNQAVKVTWTVLLHISPCQPQSSSYNKSLTLDYNNQVTQSFDNVGAMTITHKFHFRKWSRRNTAYTVGSGGSTTTDTSYVGDDIRDQFWQYFNSVIELQMPGPTPFRETVREVTFSKDYTSADVTIVFKEQPSDNYLFPYCINIRADHEISSDLINSSPIRGSGFVSWENIINAEITVGKEVSSSAAIVVWWWLFLQRFKNIKKAQYVNKNANNKNEQQDNVNGTKVRNFLTRLSIKENIYERSHRFSAKYCGVYTLSELIQQSGLFSPIYITTDPSGLYPWMDNYWQSASYGFIVDASGNKSPSPEQLSDDSINAARNMNRLLANNETAATYQDKIASKIFDPCNAMSASSKFDTLRNVRGRYKETNPSISGDLVNPSIKNGEIQDRSYIGLSLNFNVLEKTNNHQIGIQHYTSDFNEYLKSNTSQKTANYAANSGAYLYGKNSNNTNVTTKSAFTSSSGGSKFVVNMSGFVTRIGSPAEVPNIIGYRDPTTGASADIYRVGTPIVRFRQISKGEEPVHVTAFSINYSVNSPINTDVLKMLELKNANSGMV